MERGPTGRDHREYEDLLSAAALGALSAEEHALLQKHLKTCESCRSTFGALLAVADSLPLQVEEHAPPPTGLRDRLHARVQPEAITSLPNYRAQAPVAPVFASGHHEATRPTSISKRPSLNWAMWGALAAAALIIAVLSGVVVDRVLLRTDEAQPETIALQYRGDLQGEQGTLQYLPEQNVLRFRDLDLPEPPDDHVYQAWLIEDSVPRPVGVIDAETGQFVTTIDRERDDTFAITVEPGPLGSAQPTTDPVIVAPLTGVT